MDWHEGLDRAKRHLDRDQIATLVGCPPSDVDRYMARDAEPESGLTERFVALGTHIERQEQAGSNSDEIRAFWGQPQPGELLKSAQFDELDGMVAEHTREAQARTT